MKSDWIDVRRDTRKGRGARGVYARRPIPEGSVVERVPVILLPKTQVFPDADVPEDIRHARGASRISWYVFEWKIPTKRPYVALALGFGSIYNHSFTPNAVYRCVAPDQIEYLALRDIAAGEEVTINYNGDPADQTPMEFPLT